MGAMRQRGESYSDVVFCGSGSNYSRQLAYSLCSHTTVRLFSFKMMNPTVLVLQWIASDGGYSIHKDGCVEEIGPKFFEVTSLCGLCSHPVTKDHKYS